jgi:hypothetical protein
MRASRIALLAALPLVLVLSSAAQTPPMPPDYAGVQVHIPGVYVTPVPNAPFSADVTILSHQKLPDGTEHIQTTINHIARDSQGRIYNERRRLVPTSFRGEPLLLEAHVFDPQSRVNIFYEPAARLAREITLPLPVAARQMPTQAPLPNFGATGPGVNTLPNMGAPRPGVAGPSRITQTDLGEQLVDNTILSGTQKQRTIDASASGTGQPVTITDQYWYAPDLSVYLIVKHDDPRTGEQIVAVTHIDRHEPSMQRFQVPEGFKIVDETPPPRQAPATPTAVRLP